MDEQNAAKRFLNKYHVLIIVLNILLVIVAAVGIYYYNQYTKVSSILKNPNVAVDKETKDLVSKVGKLIMLPKGEQPTVATVTDASKLKNQSFFQNASNGDRVLIYMKARKAILYNPTLNIIVDIAPVNPDSGASASQQAQGVPTHAVVSPSIAPTGNVAIPTALPTATK